MIESLKDAETAEVYIDSKTGTPHCKKHGAMNMMSPEGIWRCISTYKVKYMTSKTWEYVGNGCISGCIFKR